MINWLMVQRQDSQSPHVQTENLNLQQVMNAILVQDYTCMWASSQRLCSLYTKSQAKVQTTLLSSLKLHKSLFQVGNPGNVHIQVSPQTAACITMALYLQITPCFSQKHPLSESVARYWILATL